MIPILTIKPVTMIVNGSRQVVNILILRIDRIEHPLNIDLVFGLLKPDRIYTKNSQKSRDEEKAIGRNIN